MALTELKNKDELLRRLRTYTMTADDDNILFKEKIKEKLINCPELLYALHNKELEGELFNKDGSLNEDGEWDRYYGMNSNIRPFLLIPQTQDKVMHYVCFQSYFNEIPRNNKITKYAQIIFTILVDGKDAIDTGTGIPRHDLIGRIIKSNFMWGNTFGNQCRVVEERESTTDNDFITRTIILELTNLNGIVQSILQEVDGKTSVSYEVINSTVRK